MKIFLVGTISGFVGMAAGVTLTLVKLSMPVSSQQPELQQLMRQAEEELYRQAILAQQSEAKT